MTGRILVDVVFAHGSSAQDDHSLLRAGMKGLVIEQGFGLLLFAGG